MHHAMVAGLQPMNQRQVLGFVKLDVAQVQILSMPNQLCHSYEIHNLANQQDLEKHQQFSCCSASPSQIDFDWLKHNTGRLFNTPLLQQERVMMLNNQPVESCRDVCFNPEKQGLSSKRLVENEIGRAHV